MPFENVCFVAKRHEAIHFDESGVCHCEDGPAIRYPDGDGFFAWHGTSFPVDWLTCKPSAEEVLKLQNMEQRRVATEMVGWDSLLRNLEFIQVDMDVNPEIGELFTVNLDSARYEKFLRVTCGTGRKFILSVPPEMQTARQANAWTWGLEPKQYKPEVRT